MTIQSNLTESNSTSATFTPTQQMRRALQALLLETDASVVADIRRIINEYVADLIKEPLATVTDLVESHPHCRLHGIHACSECSRLMRQVHQQLKGIETL